MDHKLTLLFVDDDEEFLRMLAKRLAPHDMDVYTFTNGEDALAAADKTNFDVALVDLRMPGMSGTELLAKLKETHPTMEVIILTAHTSLNAAMESAKLGAYEFLQKPYNTEELVAVLNKAYAKHIMSRQSHKAKRINELLADAVGYSPIEILERLRKIDKE